MERYKIWHLRKRHGVGGRDKGKRQLEELSSQISELQTQLTKQKQIDNEEDLFSSGSEEEGESNKTNQELFPFVRQKHAKLKRILRKGGSGRHCKKKC